MNIVYIVQVLSFSSFFVFGYNNEYCVHNPMLRFFIFWGCNIEYRVHCPSVANFLFFCVVS